MDEATLARVSLVATWIMFGLIRGYYSRKDKSKDRLEDLKKSFEEVEGKEGKVFLAVSAVILIAFLIEVVLWLFVPQLAIWAQIPLPPQMLYLGIAFGILSVVLLIWVHDSLGKQWSISLAIGEEHKLITEGPYRWVRHPMYSTLLLLSISWILISADIIISVFSVYSFYANYRRIPREEEMLIHQFGDAYIEYKKRTGRVFPKLT
ncbi:MAG: isoprenylcysteine carboxylmethyltransferase family protein [Candidatus Thorarchaeota archaeon]|nr:isoprenylcysteine carboxylmethyltransferase family protein [Candidatus Thorarchaeota archaeon]